MNIIGHRGVAGMELENTRGSLIRAMNIGLRSIEIDVRKTKDNRLVLCHDADLRRISNSSKKVSQHTLDELQKIPLADGSHIITLEEALEITDGAHVIIEMKDEACGRELRPIIRPYQRRLISIASFRYRELAVYQDLGINNDLYGLEHTKPFDIIQYAKSLRLQGIGLNFWLLNPLTYYLCKRAKLNIYVYTVNRPLFARMISWLYPSVGICTDEPYTLSPKGEFSAFH